MKIISRITIFVLIALLFAQSAPLVKAKGESKKPDPKFMDTAIHIDKSYDPSYSKNAIIDTYLDNGMLYFKDVVTQDVVEIQPEVLGYKIEGTYTEYQLRGMAETMVAEFLGGNVKLDKLSYSLGQKVGTYFFRWEDTNQQLDSGGYPFIQVGLSQNGDFLNFYNTLPFGHEVLTSSGVINRTAIVLVGSFSQFYANGGAYWTGGSGLSTATGGWYYLNPSGCSGTFCSKYYYTTTSLGGGGLLGGTWTPNSNINTRAKVFIPNYNATAVVQYQVFTGNGSTYFFATVDQNAYFNSLAFIASTTVPLGIKKVGLNNYGTTTKLVAWDELWVYNP